MLKYLKDAQNIENITNQLNNTNNGQVFANSDYTVNTESLVGKPSSYFQNNNTNNTANTIGQSNSNTMENNNSIFQSFNTLNPASIGYNIGQKLGELSAEYDLGIRKDYISHTGMLKAKYNFW